MSARPSHRPRHPRGAQRQRGASQGAEVLFEAPQGLCELHYPHRASRGASTTLRAWDAADEHLLRALEAWREERRFSKEELKGEAWVIGDAFGALTLPLLLAYPQLRVRVSLELVASEGWIRDNLARTLTHHPALDQRALEARVSFGALSELNDVHKLSEGECSPPFISLLKVPQQLSLWARQLDQLSEALSVHPQEVWASPRLRPLVMAGGMCKHVHTSTIKAMEARLGPSPTSLAWRKSRLILPTLESAPVTEMSQKSAQEITQEGTQESAPETTHSAPLKERVYQLSAQDLSCEALSPHLARLELVNTPGVFSEGALDQGARALLPHLSGALERALEARERAELPITKSNPLRVADLGCGDGVLSFVFAALALERGVRVELLLFDVAVSALESAELTWARWREGLSEQERARLSLRCLGGDALAPWRAQPSHERAPFDVILNNPPFHQKGARLSSISAQMFREARDALAPWGALWVVGNRQLGYHAALKRLFERAMVPSEHPKFVVVCAERPRLPSRA